MIGFLSDRVGRINVAALSTLIAGLAAFLLWILAGQYYAGSIVYSLFGMFAGAIWPCIAPVAVEVVGLQLLPSCETTSVCSHDLNAPLPSLFSRSVLIWPLTNDDGSACLSFLCSHVHHLARPRAPGDFCRGDWPQPRDARPGRISPCSDLYRVHVLGCVRLP